MTNGTIVPERSARNSRLRLCFSCLRPNPPDFHLGARGYILLASNISSPSRPLRVICWHKSRRGGVCPYARTCSEGCFDYLSPYVEGGQTQSPVIVYRKRNRQSSLVRGSAPLRPLHPSRPTTQTSTAPGPFFFSAGHPSFPHVLFKPRREHRISA